MRYELSGYPGRFRDFDGMIYLERQRLDRGGYTGRGQYFGQGAPLFMFEDERGEFYGHVRAPDRKTAKEKIRKDFPKAKIAR